MKRILVLSTVLVLVALGWRVGTSPRAVRPDALPASRPETVPSLPAANAPSAGVAVSRDPAAVFQRAFWRRPDSTVRILDGERREWRDETAAVQKWQWFLAVQTTAEFRRWLLEQNPFELTRAETAIDPAHIESPPDWFSPATAQEELTAYRTRGGRLTVFINAKSGRLFATDSGAGFAAAVR